MIYNSTIKSVVESDIMDILENAEDRFENETMAEATAIVVGEQETNWTRFMQAVGLSELATIMDGEEVVYEGARFKNFVDKAKEIFNNIINKLADLTKSFINKINEAVKNTNEFIKKHKPDLMGKVDYSKINATMKGYEFKHFENHPVYEKGLNRISTVDPTGANAKSIMDSKESLTAEAAQNSFFDGDVKGDSFKAKINNWFYSEKHEIKLDQSEISKQLKVLEGTKELRKKANSSYVAAVKQIRKIISDLKKMDSKAKKNEENGVSQAFSIVLGYWKSFANACTLIHGAYLGMLAKRYAQAKYACTKVLAASGVSKVKSKKDDKNEEVKTEGFIDTVDFLGAVDFI